MSTSLFNGFTQRNQAHFIEPANKSDLKHWREFFDGGNQKHDSAIGQQVSNFEKIYPGKDVSASQQLPERSEQAPFNMQPEAELTQLLNTYIVTPSGRGFMLIHQQAAHERILYDKFISASKGKLIATQRSMFPVTIELTPADSAILAELMVDLHELGYMIEPFGKNTFVIQGSPADLEAGNEKNVVELLLEQYKHFNPDMKFSKREKLVRSLAKQHAIKAGVRLTEREMMSLVNDLFSSAQPNSTADGNPTYLEFKSEQLEKMFRLV